MNIICWNIEIYGQVQGVGFRPFLHRLAQQFSLSGQVCNHPSGVLLTLEADEETCTRFLADMRTQAPPAAHIDSVRIERSTAPVCGGGFHIAPSRGGSRADTLISPDLGICPSCLRELNDPADRRHGHPFINCTDCGPRFTVVRDVPYDRVRTSMEPFPMCPACAAEYHDLSSRRYHAQPNCCPVCGPQLLLYDAAGQRVPGNALETARRLLAEGKILAVKGLGGIHLACRADDAALIAALRARKRRDARPFAIMCRDLAAIERLCHVTEDERRALCAPEKPIVLLRRRGEPDALSFTQYLGVMLPYTPLHHLLFSEGLDCLVMTSANPAQLPIVCGNDEALQALSGIADAFLLHEREIAVRCDDSLIWVQDGAPRFVRRSRGWTPAPVSLPDCRVSVLACGAEQKASFCLTRPGAAFPGGHIGDLKCAETLAFYRDQQAHLSRLLAITPQLVACDLHPDYLSTAAAEQLAAERGLPLVRVQHHHAHLAACMADNDLQGEVLGLIWDGTGLGTDGTIWGAELLRGGYGGFARLGTLRPIPLPGGEAAIRQIWRIGLALLQQAGVPQPEAFFPGIRTAPVSALLRSGVGCIPSHGMGRLFDGMCAILGLLPEAGFEGHGAMLLEAAADEAETGSLPLPLIRQDGLLLADWGETVRAAAEALRGGTAPSVLAARFLNALVALGAAQCRAAREETGLDRVVLSGGVFQNRFLSARLPAQLRTEGFRVYIHRRVSTNDEGLSLGQAMIAAHSGGFV